MKSRSMTPQGAALLGLVFIGLIWLGDGILRAVQVPAGTITNVGELKAEETTQASQTTETVDGLVVQDAVMDLSSVDSSVPEGYTTVPLDEPRIHTGLLVQVDANHPFTAAASEFVTFETKNESYRMKRMDLLANEAVVLAMNNMCSAYQSATGAANFMVYSTIEPYNVAGSLYPDALPDRATGYCVDLCLLNADESISRMEAPHDWLAANAHSYGFVYSYTDGNSAETGVAAAPYHLRYIGPVHAGIMQQENLTLTSYYAYLKNHTVDVPLFYTYGDTTYTVYYVPAESGTTDVPVPLNANYEISGNNADGFIVTVGASTAAQ